MNDGEADAVIDALMPYLKPDKADQARIAITRTVSKFHQGPIPSAEELEHLDRVHPGAAKWCLDRAEQEQTHRHKIEDKIVDREFALRSRGQIFAIIGLILLLIAVGYLAFLGATTAAASLGTATIVGVVGVFVTGKLAEREISQGSPEPTPPPSRQEMSRSERRNAEFKRR